MSKRAEKTGAPSRKASGRRLKRKRDRLSAMKYELSAVRKAGRVSGRKVRRGVYVVTSTVTHASVHRVSC